MTENTLEAVRREVTVPLPPDRAFELFTARMETWWPEDYHIAEQRFESIVLEPRVGGRWAERAADGSECPWGTVLAYEPPERLLLAWQIDADWRPVDGTENASEVEIRFVAEGEGSTRVALEHRGFERHGERHTEIRETVSSGGGWGALLELYRKAA